MSETSGASRGAPWILRWSMLLLLPAMGALFAYDRFASSPAQQAARVFLDHLRAGRDDAAMAMTTDAFRNDLQRGVTHHDNPTPSDTPAEVLGAVRRSRGASESERAMGYGVRCLELHLDVPGGPDTLYIELQEYDGVRKVDGLAVRRAFGLCD